MEAQNGRQKIEKNSKKNERLKIHAGAGDIIVLGGTIIAAAIGAAFVAHMGRRRGENRERERRKNDEERGLQSLLHLGKGESSTDSLIIQENKGKESLPVESHGKEKSEKGEDGSEESGNSSIETSNEAVWPEEATEQEKEMPISDLNEMKHLSVDDIGMGMQSTFPYKSSNDQGDDEFAFDNSVQNQETKYVETVAENAFNVINTNVGNVVVNDFSFWSNKQNTPQGESTQCIEKSDIAHVTKNELFDEEVEKAEIPEEEVEKEGISERNNVKQQLELSETTGDMFASERESNMGVLENLLPSSIYTEQQNGHVSVDTLEGTKEEEEEVLNSESKEVKEIQVEDAGARGGEESEGSRNCLEVSRDQSVCEEDRIEQKKLDDVMPTNDINNQHDILRKFESMDGSAHGYMNYNNNPVQESSSHGVDFDALDKETGENLEDLKITDIEVDLKEKVEDDDEGEKGGDQNTHREVVESEEEEEKGGDGLAYLNAKVKAGDYITDIEVEVEKDANGEDGVAAEVESEGRGDDFTHTEVEEEEQQQNRGDHISDKEVEVLERCENGGDVVAIEVEFEARVDAIAHIEVEEEQPQNGGNDITLTKSTLENEVQKGEDDIAPPEVEVIKEVEGDEEKKGNEEGIANRIADMEAKEMEVDEATEERADANAHIQVEAAEEEEQKGGDNISYTEVKELRAEEAEEEGEGKGHCVAYIEVEEGKGHISNQEVDVVEEVKEDEKEEDITNVEVTKAKGKEKGEDGAPESLLLKSLEKEIRSPVQEDNEIQESTRLDGTSMAEEVGLEKRFEPKYETKQNLETTEKINEMVGITSAERDGNTNGGIQSFLPNNDKNIDVPVGNVVVNDFSFSENKQTTPEGQSEQCIEKSGIAHVTKNSLSVEEVERKEIPEEEVEKEEISETNEVKQRLEISEKKTECENKTGVLEDLLPSIIYIEQQNGQVSVDSLEGKKDEEEEVFNSNSKEVKEFQVEDVGAKGGEESEGSRNCLAVSSDQSIFQEDIIEHEQLDDLMPTNEINDQYDILRKFESMNRSAEGYTNYNNNPVLESSSNGVEFDTLDKETGEDLEDLKTASTEVDLIEKEEEEEDDDDDDDEREGGGAQNAHIEVVESEEEEERGGDGLAHLTAKVKAGDDISDIEVEEVEKDENGGDGVAIGVENEGRGDDFTYIEVVEEERQNRGDYISNKEVEVLEKDENEGDVVATEVEFQARVDDIGHVEVEEQQQRNGGNDVTNTKSMSENEIQKGKDDIAPAEVEVVKGVESEEEKGGNAEGIDGKEVKGVEVDAAKVERRDANTHIQVEVAEEEEQKGGDNISYTEVEELREEEAEEEDEEKGHRVDYIEVEEEKGDNSTHEEVDMIEEEVEEEKGDKSTHEEVDMIAEEVEEEKEDISTHEEVDMTEEVREDKKEGEDITRREVPEEKGKEKGEDGEQESLSLKSPKKEIRSPVQEENENEIQDSIRSDGTAMEFNRKETCMAEEAGLEKHFEPMYETKQNLETHEKISEMVGITSAERDENTNGGIQSFLPHNDECIEVPGGISPVVQEKVHVKDVREESQNTCRSFELARETDANVDQGDSVTKDCPYGVEISSFSQNDSKQDLQEPDFSCIVEEKDGLFTEAEIESCIEKDGESKDGESANDESEETRISSKRTTGETISQTRVPEKEEQLPFIENEMKLQSEMARKATDIVNSKAQVEENGQEHEHNVPNKEAEMTVTGQEKKMDFMLTGHSKVLFFFVLALALALGFLALAYDEQFHSYNHHLPKFFRGLYQYLLSIL